MFGEIGKWLLDISKYLITGYVLAKIFGQGLNMGCNRCSCSCGIAVCLRIVLFTKGQR